jgi:hypothetical protein
MPTAMPHKCCFQIPLCGGGAWELVLMVFTNRHYEKCPDQSCNAFLLVLCSIVCACILLVLANFSVIDGCIWL